MSFEILSPNHFGSLRLCGFKPKGLWLNSHLSPPLSFQVFFYLLLSAIPCQPGDCWLCQCVPRPSSPLHFPQCLYSQCVFYRVKKELIAEHILETFPWNLKGLTEIPWGDALPIPFSRTLVCCCFSHLCILHRPQHLNSNKEN